MKHAHICAALALAFVALAAGPALAAAADTRAPIPYGDAAAWFITTAGEAAWVLVAGVLATFAKPIWGALRIARLDQLLEKSLKGAFEARAEELRGKTITVDLRHALIAEAARNAIVQGQASLIQWAGEEGGVKQKLLARFSDELADWLSKQK